MNHQVFKSTPSLVLSICNAGVTIKGTPIKNFRDHSVITDHARDHGRDHSFNRDHAFEVA